MYRLRLSHLEYKWQAAIVVAVGLFLSVLDSTIVSVALPAMQRSFASDFDTITWVATGYFLAQAGVIPVTGYLSDRIGTRTIFLTSLLVFVGASAWCALAPSESVLIAARVVQGIGGGALWPTAFAIGYRAFPEEERGRATAVVGAPVLLAPALGPCIGGYLTTLFGWHAIFAINLPIGLAALLLGARVLRGREQDCIEDEAAGSVVPSHVKRFDVLGFCLAIGAFTGLVYGLTDAGLHGWSHPLADRFLLGSGAALLLFILVELRAADPVLDLRLFLQGTFARANTLLCLVVGLYYGSLFLIPFFFENVQGHSPLTSGEILVGQGVAAAAGIALGGELYNRVGPRVLVTAGVALLAVSMLGFTHLSATTSGLGLQGWLVLRGLGLGLTTMPLQNLAVSGLRREALTRASSLVNSSRQVFGAAGVAGLAAYLSQEASAHAAEAQSLAAGPCRAASLVGAAGLSACIRQNATVMGLNSTFTLTLIASTLCLVPALVLGRDRAVEAARRVRRSTLPVRRAVAAEGS